MIEWSESEEKGRNVSTPRTSSSRHRKDDDSDIPIRTRPRGSGVGKWVFVGLTFLVFAAIGGTVLFLVLGHLRSEEQAAVAASAAYEEGKYAEAKRKFDTLVADYPSSADVERYRFFSALSGLQAVASGVSVKDDPAPAKQTLTTFLSDFGGSPLAQPNTGFGADIVLVGQKVCSGIADNATDLVKKFQADRTKPERLEEADRAIAGGRELIPLLEKFRDRSGLSLDDTWTKFDTAAAAVQSERDRLSALAPWRDVAFDPTDERIDQFEKAMKAANLKDDPEVRSMVAEAKIALRNSVVYTSNEVPASPFPRTDGAILTAATRVADTPVVTTPTGRADVVFGMGRGVVFALDSRTGNMLWVDRTSHDPQAVFPPLRLTVPNGVYDWVLVASVRGGQAAVTARSTFTGEPVWYVPLLAPVVGTPIQVGSRLVVPLSDARGTLIVLDLMTGKQLGTVEIHQPIGGGIASLRGADSGHAFVIVPGDARRVFVFGIGRRSDNGDRLPLEVVRVYATEHPRGSLRGFPLVIDPDNPDMPRRVILTQSVGPAEMKLRSFTLPSVKGLTTPSIDGDVMPDQSAEAAVGGWSWFPPLTNGERIAVCTDTGVFAAFGLNLPGQADRPLYELPAEVNSDPTSVSRCQVVSMDEDSFWIIRNGTLSRLQVASDPGGGQRILPTRDTVSVGEPIAPAQVLAEEGLAIITTKTTDFGTVHVRAFDLASGDVRWCRQLGITAVGGAVSQPDGSQIIVDECGGIYRLSASEPILGMLDNCEPKAGVSRPAVTAVSPTGSQLWVAVQVRSTSGEKLLIRTIANGSSAGDERSIELPAGIAGNAVEVDGRLLIPLKNGFLYRIGREGTTLQQGPVWRGANVDDSAVCHLATLGDEQFVYSDGNNQAFRRRWLATASECEKTGGPWDLAGPMTGPAVQLESKNTRLLCAGTPFGVSVIDLSKPSADPIRRLQPNAENHLPTGRSAHLSADKNVVYWSIEAKTVAAATDANPNPDWIYPLRADIGDVAGLTPSQQGVLVTGTSGVVVELSISGEVTGEASIPSGGPLAVQAATRIGERDVLLPLSDGTISRLRLQPR